MGPQGFPGRLLAGVGGSRIPNEKLIIVKRIIYKFEETHSGYRSQFEIQSCLQRCALEVCMQISRRCAHKMYVDFTPWQKCIDLIRNLHTQFARTSHASAHA